MVPDLLDSGAAFGVGLRHLLNEIHESVRALVRLGILVPEALHIGVK